MKNYVSKIQKLEGELQRLQSSVRPKHNEYVDFDGLDDSGLQLKDPYYAESDVKGADLSGRHSYSLQNLLKEKFLFSPDIFFLIVVLFDSDILLNLSYVSVQYCHLVCMEV